MNPIYRPYAVVVKSDGPITVCQTNTSDQKEFNANISYYGT